MNAASRPAGSRAALLDIDGTLLISNDAHAESWQRGFAEFGFDVEFERLRRMIGMGGDKLIAAAVPGLSEDTPPGSEVAQRRKRLFLTEYLPRLVAAPGSRELVRRLRDDGYRITVATSAKGDELKQLLEAAGVADLIEQAATSDDARESKPDPDIVLSALQRSKCAPQDAVFLGDTPYDVDASRRAGVRIVGVRCGGWADHDLRGAVAIYNDPADVLANYDESPFALPSRFAKT